MRISVKRTKKIGKIVTLAVLTTVLLFYLLPNVTVIEQSLEIKATPDRVFELINRPNNWVRWYVPLTDSQSNVRIRYSGPSEGKDAGMQWKTDNPKISGGTMNIRNSKNNRSVSAVIDLNERHSAVMNFKLKPVGKDASLLTITSRLRFPQDSLLHYLRMMFDRSDELEIIDCLENIDDAVAENTKGIAVWLQRIEPFSYIGITDSCDLKDVSLRMKDLYDELTIFAAKSGLSMIHRPIAVYRKFTEKQAVFEVGIPVNGMVQASGRIRNETMPGGNNVTADYYGSYDTLEDGHNAVQRWLTHHGKKVNGYPWEMYVTDPAAEPDANRWLTRIFYPVE